MLCTCDLSHLIGLQQARMFYAGTTRILGTYDAMEEAAAAFEIARKFRKNLGNWDLASDQMKKNVDLMKKASKVVMC